MEGFWPQTEFQEGLVLVYLIALLITPAVMIVTLGVALASGAVSLSGFAQLGISPSLPLVTTAFGAAMAKNIFEEFAWRGYLTPRLEAIKLHPFTNSNLTGLIWAAWHVPYCLYFLDRAVLDAHTTLSLPVCLLLAFLILPFTALAYAELRLSSGSVWPVWLMYNVANAISLPLLSDGFLTLNPGFAGVLLSPGDRRYPVFCVDGLDRLWALYVPHAPAFK